VLKGRKQYLILWFYSSQI